MEATEAFFLAGDDAGVAGVAVAATAAAAGGRPGRFLDGIEGLAFAMTD